METTGMRAPFSVGLAVQPAASRRDRLERRPPSASNRPPGRGSELGNGSEIVLELARKRGFELEPLACERVVEAEAAGVQELAPEAVVRDAVDRVADDRQVDRGQVDADLVHPPRLEPDGEERVLWVDLLDLEVRDGLARRLAVERDQGRVRPVPADRGLDPAGARGRPAADEGRVAPLEPPGAD